MRARTVLKYLVLTALAVVVLFPIYITVVNSLLTPEAPQLDRVLSASGRSVS